MVEQLILLVWVVVIIWISILSVFLFRMIGHYNRLTYGTTEAGA